MHIKNILKILCLSDPSLLKRNGSINQNAVERATGVNQTTIKRILDGESHQPKDNNIRKIADYFSITLAQARGDEPLPKRFLNLENRYSDKIKSPLHTIQEPTVDSRRLPSAIQTIYQAIINNSDKIDHEIASEIVDFIRFKLFQLDNSSIGK